MARVSPLRAVSGLLAVCVASCMLQSAVAPDPPAAGGAALGPPDDPNAPLYVLPMAPLEWKLGNLITNPFMNAIDPKKLENGQGPTPGQWAQITNAGAAPEGIGAIPQPGNAVQPAAGAPAEGAPAAGAPAAGAFIELPVVEGSSAITESQPFQSATPSQCTNCVFS